MAFPNTISAIKQSLLKNQFIADIVAASAAKFTIKNKNKITIEDLGDATIELLEKINKGLNKFLPPMTYRYRQRKRK